MTAIGRNGWPCWPMWSIGTGGSAMPINGCYTQDSPHLNPPIALATPLCNEGHVTDVETICG